MDPSKRRFSIAASLFLFSPLNVLFADSSKEECPKIKTSRTDYMSIVQKLYKNTEGIIYTNKRFTPPEPHRLNKLNEGTLSHVEKQVDVVRGQHVARSKKLINAAYERGKQQEAQRQARKKEEPNEQLVHQKGIDSAISFIKNAQERAEDAVKEVFQEFGYTPREDLSLKENVNNALASNGELKRQLQSATNKDPYFNIGMYHNPDVIREAVLKSLATAKSLKDLNLTSVYGALERAAEEDSKPILQAIEAAKECTSEQAPAMPPQASKPAPGLIAT